MIGEVTKRTETALGDKWDKQLEIKIIPITYENKTDGSQIIYYVCHTTFFSDEIPDSYDLQEIMREIIDPETSDESTPCKVYDIDAMRYRKAERSYLCFTI